MNSSIGNNGFMNTQLRGVQAPSVQPDISETTSIINQPNIPLNNVNVTYPALQYGPEQSLGLMDSLVNIFYVKLARDIGTMKKEVEELERKNPDQMKKLITDAPPARMFEMLSGGNSQLTHNPPNSPLSLDKAKAAVRAAGFRNKKQIEIMKKFFQEVLQAKDIANEEVTLPGQSSAKELSELVDRISDKNTLAEAVLGFRVYLGDIFKETEQTWAQTKLKIGNEEKNAKEALSIAFIDGDGDEDLAAEFDESLKDLGISDKIIESAYKGGNDIPDIGNLKKADSKKHLQEIAHIMRPEHGPHKEIQRITVPVIGTDGKLVWKTFRNTDLTSTMNTLMAQLKSLDNNTKITASEKEGYTKLLATFIRFMGASKAIHHASLYQDVNKIGDIEVTNNTIQGNEGQKKREVLGFMAKTSRNITAGFAQVHQEMQSAVSKTGVLTKLYNLTQPLVAGLGAINNFGRIATGKAITDTAMKLVYAGIAKYQTGQLGVGNSGKTKDAKGGQSESAFGLALQMLKGQVDGFKDSMGGKIDESYQANLEVFKKGIDVKAMNSEFSTAA